jgi:hypothetical protein
MIQGLAVLVGLVFFGSYMFIFTSCLAGVGDGVDHVSFRAWYIAWGIFVGCFPAWVLLAALS